MATVPILMNVTRADQSPSTIVMTGLCVSTWWDPIGVTALLGIDRLQIQFVNVSYALSTWARFHKRTKVSPGLSEYYLSPKMIFIHISIPK